MQEMMDKYCVGRSVDFFFILSFQRFCEGQKIPVQTDLDDGCDELLQECVFEQRRPVVVEEVDEKTFDVGAVLILQPHAHTHTHVGQ